MTGQITAAIPVLLGKVSTYQHMYYDIMILF